MYVQNVCIYEISYILFCFCFSLPEKNKINFSLNFYQLTLFITIFITTSVFIFNDIFGYIYLYIQINRLRTVTEERSTQSVTSELKNDYCHSIMKERRSIDLDYIYFHRLPCYFVLSSFRQYK